MLKPRINKLDDIAALPVPMTVTPRLLPLQSKTVDSLPVTLIIAMSRAIRILLSLLLASTFISQSNAPTLCTPFSSEPKPGYTKIIGT